MFNRFRTQKQKSCFYFLYCQHGMYKCDVVWCYTIRQRSLQSYRLLSHVCACVCVWLAERTNDSSAVTQSKSTRSKVTEKQEAWGCLQAPSFFVFALCCIRGSWCGPVGGSVQTGHGCHGTACIVLGTDIKHGVLFSTLVYLPLTHMIL